MNVWGRNLRLHIPLKDIFLMHYLAPTLIMQFLGEKSS